MSNLNKYGKLKLETTAFKQQLKDTNIEFYNNDINTSILSFQITKNNKPLLLSENNVSIDIFLNASDGSYLIDDEVEFIEPLNGLVNYQLPNWFLNHHGKVKAQIYISLNGVDDTVTEVEFTFNIKDDLINTIPAKDKVTCFRTFIELRNRIYEKVQQIENEIANGTDYVAEMKTTLNEGLQQLTDITNTSEENITTKTQNFLSEIKSSYETTKNELEQSKTNAMSSVTAKSDESIQDMQNIKDIAKVEFEDTLANFKEEIANNSFVRPDTLDNYVEKVQLDYYATKVDMENFIDETELSTKLTDMNVQQFALTNNDSTTKFLNLSGIIENLKALPTSMYYVTNVPNLPSNVSSTAGFLIVLKRNSDYSKFIFSPYNSNQTFVSYKIKNNTLEWDSLGPISDTGWLPFNLINGSMSNSAYGGSNGFSCSYRIIDHGKRKEKIIRLNGKNIVDKQQIAQLPVNFTENTQVHPIRTPQRSTGGFITVYPDGSVSFFKTGGYEWYTDDDIYGEISWFE